MDVTADSVVVICDAPTTFSWIVNPVLPDRLRRVQWWFHLTPEGDSTRVVHEVEVDFGDLQDEMLKGLRDNFEQVRAPVIRAGNGQDHREPQEDGCAVGILLSGRSCNQSDRTAPVVAVRGDAAVLAEARAGRSPSAAQPARAPLRFAGHGALWHPRANLSGLSCDSGPLPTPSDVQALKGSTAHMGQDSRVCTPAPSQVPQRQRS